jgi:hypothetical protein
MPADFLSCMPQECAEELLIFISGIESDKDSDLKKQWASLIRIPGLVPTRW